MARQMNLPEFFDAETVALPISAFHEGKQQTFDQFLSEVFRKYVLLVRTLDDHEYLAICSEVQSSLGQIESLCNQITLAVDHYLRGYPSQAYGEIEKALDLLNVDKLITPLTGFVPGHPSMNDDFLNSILHPPLYRMRPQKIEAASGTLSRKELFHVPFEIRHRVQNQRYSIAGLPCLYLGSSTWICWEELGRPDLDRVFVSRFRIVEETKVLDFQFPPPTAWVAFQYALNESINQLYPTTAAELRSRYNDGFIAAYIAFWPLIAACSVGRGSRDGAFYPQYIVPQLLLQWVTKARRVDGIRYFSTRTRPGADPHTNCAFPAREIAASGRCSYLRRKFHLTDPIAWSILREIDMLNAVDSGPSNHDRFITLTDDVRFYYPRTGFFQAELTLRSIEEMPRASKAVEA
jgi:hypothetical protein